MRVAQPRYREPEETPARLAGAASTDHEEDAVKPTPHAHAVRTKVTRATEVYCRRDNRMVVRCAHVAAGSLCRCLSEVETADALFESDAADAVLGR